MKFNVEEIHTIITALIYRKHILNKEIESMAVETIKAINEKEIQEIDSLLKKIKNSKW